MKEQTTIRLPEKLKEQSQREADEQEVRRFIKFIQKLNKSEQMGVLTMIQGLEMMKGFEEKL